MHSLWPMGRAADFSNVCFEPLLYQQTDTNIETVVPAITEMLKCVPWQLQELLSLPPPAMPGLFVRCVCL